MSEGYIKLYRKIHDSGFLTDGPLLQVFMWLITKATHKPRRLVYMGQVFNIDSGQVFMSFRKLAQELELSIEVVRRCIRNLESTHTITHQSTHIGSIVTFCNWDSYQGSDSPTNTPRPHQPTRRDHTETTLRPQEQECKNGRMKENKGHPPYEELRTEWNRLAGRSGLAVCQVLNTKRKQAIKARWADEWFRNAWKNIFFRAHCAKWCKENRAGIDHVLRPGNALRYYEESKQQNTREFANQEDAKRMDELISKAMGKKVVR